MRIMASATARAFHSSPQRRISRGWQILRCAQNDKAMKQALQTLPV